MRIVHLGGNRLGERILEILRASNDEVATTTLQEPLQTLLDEAPTDWIVSAGFRHLVPAHQLARVGDACNVHTSLLPWGRGSHPNAWAIYHQEPAGVTIHRMTPKVDAGPIFVQRRVDTSFGDVASVLYQRLEDAAVELFQASWPDIKAGRAAPYEPQGVGSYHRTVDLLDLGRIDLDDSVTWRQALNTLRALTFPPYRNFLVEDGGKSYQVELSVTEIEGGPPEASLGMPD